MGSRRAPRPRRRSWPRIPARVLVPAVAVLLLGLLAAARLSAPGPRPLPGADYEPPRLGMVGAPVTLSIYSDLSAGCPACLDLARSGVIAELERRYVASGRLSIVFHHFPFSGPQAFDIAEAAACTSEQGLFWRYHDALAQKRPAAERTALTDLAVASGADAVRFSACLDERRYRAAINREGRGGAGLDIKNAPTLFVNARRLEGAQPLETLVQAIEQELQRSR